MAYNKTTWVNNTTPIDENNLNKIEKGIYDNSLVVDAVTNTLNPTDTETYKTAELTEGQITDVIGVNDIVIKGDTEQDGTPTPSAPVDVNVVSGSNVINTSSKNLLKISGTSKTINGITFSQNNDGSITAKGTATADTTYISNKLQQINEGVRYTLTGCPSGGSTSTYRLVLRCLAENGTTYTATVSNTGGSSNVTPPSGSKYMRGEIWVYNGQTINKTFYPQLELGSTATAYTPYQGKELPLDLPVENLFKLEDASSLYWGVNYSISKSELLLDGTTNGANVDIYKNTSNYITLKAGTYTISSYKLGGSYKYTGDIAINLRNVDNNTTYMAISKNTNYTQSQVITLTEDTNIYLQIYTNASGNILNNLKIGLQIEKGSKANAYNPYGTDPIELCKIGDYQDYFYKSGSKWYLHKEIGKTIFNGSESWSYSSGNLVFYTDVLTLSRTNSNLFCNRFSKVANTTTYANMNTGEIKYDGAGNRRIIIKYTDVTSAADFKTWLASNNTTVYYPLATATDTEITDTTLISQLEAIYNAPLYEQTNITQTNNDLPMVLDITACKDNINGIKAFIRK